MNLKSNFLIKITKKNKKFSFLRILVLNIWQMFLLFAIFYCQFWNHFTTDQHKYSNSYKSIVCLKMVRLISWTKSYIQLINSQINIYILNYLYIIKSNLLFYFFSWYLLVPLHYYFCNTIIIMLARKRLCKFYMRK